MRSAVIVSTARTPIGRAYRGAFNALPSQTLAAKSIEAAVQRAGRNAGEAGLRIEQELARGDNLLARA